MPSNTGQPTRPCARAQKLRLLAAAITFLSVFGLSQKHVIADHIPIPISNGLPPLHQAALAGDLELIKILIERGADVNAVSMDQTPLSEAIMSGHKDVVEYLLEHGADANQKINVFVLNKGETSSQGGFAKFSPLEIAKRSHDEELERILEKYAARWWEFWR
jgi:ankyrin repeat protein